MADAAAHGGEEVLLGPAPVAQRNPWVPWWGTGTTWTRAPGSAWTTSSMRGASAERVRPTAGR